nr:hypothetical protein LTR18_002336 [Exophiala xenobiotica]
MALVDAELPFPYAVTLLSAVSCIANLGLLYISGAGYFAITIPVVLCTLYAIQKYYLRTSRQLRLLELEEKAPLYTLFGETASGLSTIRAFNWTSQFLDRNLILLDRSQRPFYLLQCIQRWLSIVLDLLVTVLVTLLMAVVVALRTTIEPGLVGLGLLTIVGLSSNLTSLVASWTTLETSIGAIARLRNFVRTTESERLPEEAIPVRDSWPEAGAIVFSNFSASYSRTSPLVLNGVHLSVDSAETIGICGRSGSGKSSALASLFHILEFRSGSLIGMASITPQSPAKTCAGGLMSYPRNPGGP